MNSQEKKKKGFTLIEALVAIFVIGAISSMMIVNWRKSENQYQIQRVAQEMAQNTRKVQDMALNGVKASGLASVPAFYGISFELLVSPVFYKICADTHPSSDPDNKCTGSDNWIEQISMENGVEIDSVYRLKTDETEEEDSIHIMFSVPDGFVFFGRADTIGALIRIKKTGTTCPSNTCRDIVIRSTGEVSIQ